MGDIELQIFSDRLKELRVSLGLTQAQFIDGLGITASALSAYEKNMKNPSISVAKRIAEKYNVSIDWLCGLTDRKSHYDTIGTFAELYQIFFDIAHSTTIYIKDAECEYTEMDFNTGYPSTHTVSFKAILYENPQIRDFFNEWEKMKGLYDDKIIDEDVYNLWKEKILTKDINQQYLNQSTNIPDNIDNELPF